MRSRMIVTLLACAALLALVALYGRELKPLLAYFFEFLGDAGPALFFLSMAVLPAGGVPLSFFTLTVGVTFAPQLGMPLVLLLALSAVTVNIALSYLLARRALRPPLEYVLQRLGYRLPEARPADATDLIVLLRVTPGIPFPVQNYLLGFAAVPFLRYLLVSCLVALPLNGAIIVFGEALLQGRGRAALLGLLAIMAMMAAISLVRRSYSRRPAPPGAGNAPEG
jgi:uncharacterized membrane protein YdjX (TVP38/TMEM64 family)